MKRQIKYVMAAVAVVAVTVAGVTRAEAPPHLEGTYSAGRVAP